MTATVRSVMVVISCAAAGTAAAQTADPREGAAPPGAWALLRELPLNARVLVTNPANESVEGTIARREVSRVILSDLRYESGRWNGERRSRSEVTLPLTAADLMRVSVMKMPRTYRQPEGGDPVAFRRFVEAHGAGTRLRVQRNDRMTVRGRLASAGADSVTLVVGDAPTPIRYAEMREIERTEGWSAGKKAAVFIPVVTVGVLMSIAAALGQQ